MNCTVEVHLIGKGQIWAGAVEHVPRRYEVVRIGEVNFQVMDVQHSLAGDQHRTSIKLLVMRLEFPAPEVL